MNIIEENIITWWFFSVDSYEVSFIPLLSMLTRHTFLIGCPLEQWFGFSCWNNTWLVNVLSLNNLCRQTLRQGNCHTQVGTGMCNSGTVRGASVITFEVDGTSVLHWWFCQHTLQQLQTQQHSMYGRSPVGVRYPCLDWPWEAPSIAQCHNLEWHKSTCAELQTLHHSCHLLVHSKQVGVYDQQLPQLSHLSSSWHPPAHRLSHRRHLIIKGTF